MRDLTGNPRRSRDEGFTLVEAVVLISVLGLIGVSVAPRFVTISEMDSARASRRALSDLRYAHQLATASGCAVQVDFVSDGYTLTHRAACRTGTFSQPIIDPASNTAPFSVVLPGTPAVSSSIDPLVFDSLGRTTTTTGAVATATITIGTRNLEAIGETGLVRVP